MSSNLSTHREKLTIDYSHCDRSGQAQLSEIALLIQNISLHHDLLLNKKHFNSEKIIYNFALLRSNLKMIEMPKWNDEVIFSTWYHPMKDESRFIYRNVIIYDKNYKEIGYCTITCFSIDLIERKAKAIPEEIKVFPTCHKVICTSENSKIKKVRNHCSEFRKTVVPTDIDMYEHVNNNRYLHWAIESTPVEIQENFFPLSTEIQFRMELQKNNEFTCKTEIKKHDQKIIANHLIKRVSDNKEISRILTIWEKRNNFNLSIDSKRPLAHF